MRRPIQIACSTYTVYALCDDGTLWMKDRNLHLLESPWSLIEGVPQEIDVVPHDRTKHVLEVVR